MWGLLPPLRLLPLPSAEPWDDDGASPRPASRRDVPGPFARARPSDSLPESVRWDPKLFLRGVSGKSTVSSAGGWSSPLLKDPFRGTSSALSAALPRRPDGEPAREDDAADETLPAPQPRKPSESAVSLPEDLAEERLAEDLAEELRTRRDLLVGKSTSIFVAVSFSY